ncbi:MAG: phage tail tape measure protein, partial [Prochlorothrix sp.]
MRNALEVLVSVVDQATGPLKKILGGVEDIQGVGSRLQSVGMAAAGVGAGMVGLAAPVLALGAGAIQTAGSFEASMNKVAAVTGATGDEFEQLRSQAMQMGATTQFSASQAAEAQQYLSMAGFNTQQTMEALPHTLNLAAAGALDLGQAADISSNILSGMGMAISELPHLNNVLAQTARSANVDVAMMGESFKYVGPVANATGQSVEMMAAAIGILGNAGIQGSQAGTVLRAGLIRLANPPRMAREALEELRTEIHNSDGSMRSFDSILRDMSESGASIGQMATIFGTEAAPGIMALMESLSNEDPRGNLSGLTEELGNTGTVAQEMADIQMQGFAGGVMLLQSAMEGLAIAVGDTGLLDWAAGAVQGLAGFVSWLTQLNPNILKFAVLIGGLGAGLLAIGGTILIVAGGLAAAVGTLITTFGAGGALAFAVPLLTSIASGIAAVIAGVVGGMAAIIGVPLLIFKIGAAMAGVQLTWGEVIGTIRSSLAQLPALLSQVPEAVGGAFSAAVVKARLFLNQIVTAVTTRAVQLVEAIRSAGAQMVETITGLAGQFLAAGKNIITSLIAGIQSKIGEAKAAIANVAETIRGALPFSPPKWGPLSDIMSAGGNIVTSIASGITPAPLASAMR